jgi:hypothetical protein
VGRALTSFIFSIALQEAVMDLRSVHTPYALVGVFVATTVPIACTDEFEGCRASRTCPSQGGDGNGSGGEAGDGIMTGGSSGSGSGTTGAAGMDDGGGGGTGGSSGSGGSAASGGEGGADDGPPTVEAFTPSDGSTAVERDIEVTAELSEPIDEATVTETSVTLTGPDGEVAGTLSVDGGVISFVPERPLYLLGTYTFTLDDTVADLDGNTLEEPASAEFHVRDGRWSEPTFPFGQSERRVTTEFQRNAFGDAVVGTETWPGYENVVAGVYLAAEDRWITGRVPNATGFVSGLGIDTQGRAAIGWQPSSGSGGWSQFGEAAGWSAFGSLGEAPIDVTVTPEGQALATLYDDSVSRYVTRLQSLGGGSLGPVEQTPLGANSPPKFLATRERFAAVGVRPVSGGEELAISWKVSTGWGTLEPLASAPEIGSFRCESDEEGNIIVVWVDAGDVYSRVYERARNAWTKPEFVVAVSPDAIPGNIDMTAGNAVLSINSFDPASATWAAVYLAGVGWDQESIVKLDEPWSGWAVAVAMDSQGNALAAWHSDLKYRRYIPGSGWSAVSPIEGYVNPYYQWAAGAPDGSVLVVTTDALNMDEYRVPFAVRFE